MSIKKKIAMIQTLERTHNIQINKEEVKMTLWTISIFKLHPSHLLQKY